MLKNSDIYPTTPLQQGMLFNSISSPSTGVEIEQIIITINDATKIELFKNAWRAVLNRHDIFKASFKLDGNGLKQIFQNNIEINIEVTDLEDKTAEEQLYFFNSFLKKDRLLDFPLHVAPLTRLAIFTFSHERIKCLWTFHHAILDGRAFSVILNEVFACYEAYEQKASFSKIPPVSFKKYIQWINERDFGGDERFWRNFLAGFNSPTQLSFPTPVSTPVDHTNLASQEIRIPQTLSSELRTFARENDLTLNTLIHGVWAILLHHYSGEDDVVFGSSWSCRYSSVEGARDMVGLLINTLPMRICIDDTIPLIDWLKKIRKAHIEMRENRYTPLKEVHKWSEIPMSGQLFNTLVVFENFYLNNSLRKQGGRWLNREFQYIGKTSFPLTLAGYDDDEILLRLEYVQTSFDHSTIKMILGHIENLLTAVIKNPKTIPSKIPYLTESEKNTILALWNSTDSEYQENESIQELFRQQVEKNPDAVALVFEGEVLTYRELDEKSNQIANYLIMAGIKKETMVGLCAERSFEMIIATLGILKSGAGYVPIDVNYPHNRLIFMVEDTKIPLLLAHRKLADKFPEGLTQIVNIDSDADIWINTSKRAPATDVDAENLAYVMYTSGSTGRPKGIEILHRNVIRLVNNTNFATIDQDEVFLQYAPISFDAATLEIWGPLLNGGKLVICPPGQVTPNQLGQTIKENGVTTLWLTAGLFHNIVAHDINCLSTIRQLLAGGDVLSPDAVRKVFDTVPGIVIINGYGPTENTTFTCCNKMANVSDVGTTVSIGRPISNTKAYILDRHLNPVPVGVVGELCTSGDGIARGYLNQPELTEKVFVDDPFSPDGIGKMYKTGDLARYLPDGRIEFIGRKDGQIKLRGYRIELGEIEANLQKHDAISQVICTVLTDSTGDKKLSAFFIPKKEIANYSSSLREFLKNKLPDYMIPQFFVKTENFPINSNGKVDRKALKLPDELHGAERKKKVEPKTHSEKMMIDIWKDVLGVKSIGMDDDFFENGGHSLIAVNVFSKIKDIYGLDLPLSTIFSASTPQLLVNEINNGIKRNEGIKAVIPFSYKHIVAINPTGKLPPLFCMHAVGGNVLNYHVFKPSLGENQPLYGLQSLGIDGLAKQYPTIETMACHYIKEIQEIQKQGPYYLCGGSMGGNIALEVAQQLTILGEKIAFLAMFDTPGPGFLNSKSGSNGICNPEHAFKKLSFNKLLFRIWNSIFARTSFYAKAIFCRLCHIFRYPIPHKIRYWYVEQMNLKPAYKYQPKPYSGDLTFFTNSLNAGCVHYKPLQGWDLCIQGQIEVIEIPAEHDKFVESPLVGANLARVLKRAQQVAMVNS